MDSSVRYTALEALSQDKDVEDTPLFIDALRDEYSSIRSLAAKHLSSHRDSLSVDDRLWQLVVSNNCYSMSKQDPDTLIRFLKQTLRSEDRQVVSFWTEYAERYSGRTPQFRMVILDLLRGADVEAKKRALTIASKMDLDGDYEAAVCECLKQPKTARLAYDVFRGKDWEFSDAKKKVVF